MIPTEAAPSLRGEVRYGLEFARLAADPDFFAAKRRLNSPPVLLVPGFMASDQSLSVLKGWLRRRGSCAASAGMWINVDCGERTATALDARVQWLAQRTGREVVLIGQSRGGQLARVLAVRNPDLVGGLVMLGSPVLDPLQVGPAVLRAVRSVARLGDLGMPGMFSSECGDGACCATYREDLTAPLPQTTRALSIYSRSDGIVAWQSCLDPYAKQIEVDSSHSGMSVHRDVYRLLGSFLDEEAQRWNG
ncbi:MAG TPA: alpha/beta hydrolase [Solirubrobacteraceae bacterium]|nr:alpha/beta hydrolase [Solirubrobacteraceae bacterium]